VTEKEEQGGASVRWAATQSRPCWLWAAAGLASKAGRLVWVLAKRRISKEGKLAFHYLNQVSSVISKRSKKELEMLNKFTYKAD
jgi:hypothetical protein